MDLTSMFLGRFVQQTKRLIVTPKKDRKSSIYHYVSRSSYLFLLFFGGYYKLKMYMCHDSCQRETFQNHQTSAKELLRFVPKNWVIQESGGIDGYTGFQNVDIWVNYYISQT